MKAKLSKYHIDITRDFNWPIQLDIRLILIKYMFSFVIFSSSFSISFHSFRIFISPIVMFPLCWALLCKEDNNKKNKKDRL